jgi:hypothetical protein
LLWLGILRLCWIGVGRVGTLVSFLNSGKWFQIFLIKYDVGYRFVIYSLYNLKYIPLFLALSELFIMNWCWILSKAFSACFEMISGFCLCFC